MGPTEPAGDPTRSLLIIDLGLPLVSQRDYRGPRKRPAGDEGQHPQCRRIPRSCPHRSCRRVLRTAKGIDRTFEVPSNGDAMMAPVTASVASCCTRRSTPAITRIPSVDRPRDDALDRHLRPVLPAKV